MDVIAVREAVAEGIRLAREERRPTLIEAFTYRYRGHSAADPEVYREREEVEEWREKDPIESFAQALRRGRRAGRARGAGGAREGRGRQVLAAVEFAEASPEPALDTLYENLYVLDGDERLVRGRRAQPRAAPRRARGATMPDAARELAEAGAAYAGQADGAAAEPGDARRRPGGRRARGRRRGRGPEAEPRRSRADGGAADARGAARRDGRGDAPRRGASS